MITRNATTKPPPVVLRIGEVAVVGSDPYVREGSDVTLVSAMKGVHDCLAAADLLAARGVSAEVVDLRTMRPPDVETIVRIAHERDVPVLTDEAWGPHFRFHPALPIDAIAAGADLVINSTHKMLAGLSQTAMLHAQGRRIERGADRRDPGRRAPRRPASRRPAQGRAAAAADRVRRVVN